MEQGQKDRDDPVDEQPEVVTRRHQSGVDGIAQCMDQIVAAHAVARLQMADHRLDGGAAPEFAPDGLRHPAPLAGGEDPRRSG